MFVVRSNNLSSSFLYIYIYICWRFLKFLSISNIIIIVIIVYDLFTHCLKTHKTHLPSLPMPSHACFLDPLSSIRSSKPKLPNAPNASSKKIWPKAPNVVKISAWNLCMLWLLLVRWCPSPETNKMDSLILNGCAGIGVCTLLGGATTEPPCVKGEVAAGVVKSHKGAPPKNVTTWGLMVKEMFKILKPWTESTNI